MAKCDICNGKCPSGYMSALYPSYQVNGIVDICPTCAKWASKKKLELLENVDSYMRAAIIQRASTSNPESPRITNIIRKMGSKLKW